MIQLKSLSLSFPHKNCFEDFSADIYDGNRIAIMGLLKDEAVMI